MGEGRSRRMSSFAANPDAIRGAITPLITPFTTDGEVDLETLARLVDWQLAAGSHAISVGGSTGEPVSQTVEERIAVMRAAVAAIDGRVPFLPGTGSIRMDETLELTAEAQRLGATAALVVSPYYARPQQEGLIAWYSRVASEFPDLPIIVYNVPIRSAVDLAPRTVGELRRRHENIVGIKETTRDFEHVSYVLDECGTDFIALSGIELLCYPMLVLGGRGHLSCVANFAPEPVAELYDAFVAGDHDRAREIHYELHALVDAAFVEVNPVPAKWIMRELGIMPSSFAREPLAPLSDASAAKIRALLPRAVRAGTIGSARAASRTRELSVLWRERATPAAGVNPGFGAPRSSWSARKLRTVLSLCSRAAFSIFAAGARAAISSISSRCSATDAAPR